jgi:hypothetical protein
MGQGALAATAGWWSRGCPGVSEPPTPDAELAAFAGAAASGDCALRRALDSRRGDNTAARFAIVDKKAARIYVFGAAGRLVGASPTLLGLARGDVAVPGSGQKDPAQLLPDERKTPAGRFASRPGVNLNGANRSCGSTTTAASPSTACAPAVRSRSACTASATDSVEDKRLSLGCVVVPEEFFSTVVMPTPRAGARHGVRSCRRRRRLQAMFRGPSGRSRRPCRPPAPESVRAKGCRPRTAVPAEPAAPVAAAPGGSGTDGGPADRDVADLRRRGV